jgi:hypothetical protein
MSIRASRLARIIAALAVFGFSFAVTIAALHYFGDRTPHEWVLVPVSLEGGRPISSGDDAGSPNRAFDGRNDTFWISAERGENVRDQAWIGYAFAAPQVIRRITIVQPGNPVNRQDFVIVEKSRNNGKSWITVSPAPHRAEGATTEIDLPDGDAASMWRVVAAGANAKSRGDAWALIEAEFYVAESRPVTASTK